jgi:hypothetical protein
VDSEDEDTAQGAVKSLYELLVSKHSSLSAAASRRVAPHSSPPEAIGVLMIWAVTPLRDAGAARHGRVLGTDGSGNTRVT